VALWALPTNLSTKVRVINKWDNAGSGWLLDLNSDAGGANLGGAIRFRVTDPANVGNDTALVTAPGVLTSTTTFVHLAAICDRAANQLRLYLNGSEIAPSPVPIVGSPDLSMPGISVGMGTLVNGPGTYYSGVLDEVRLYDRALSDAEIQALATLSVLRPRPPT
jgi:hypothetical protein